MTALRGYRSLVLPWAPLLCCHHCPPPTLPGLRCLCSWEQGSGPPVWRLYYILSWASLAPTRPSLGVSAVRWCSLMAWVGYGTDAPKRINELPGPVG